VELRGPFGDALSGLAACRAHGSRAGQMYGTLDQFRRKRSKMSAHVSGEANAPDIARVGAVAVPRGIAMKVVVVRPRRREMDHVLVSVCKAVPRRLRHTAFLRPDQPVPDLPAVVDRECLYPTGDAGEALSPVRVADVEEHRAAWPKNTPPLTQALQDRLCKLLRRLLLADLILMPVVPLLPVRGRGHDHVDAVVREVDLPRIPGDHLDERVSVPVHATHLSYFCHRISDLTRSGGRRISKLVSDLDPELVRMVHLSRLRAVSGDTHQVAATLAVDSRQ